MKYNHILFSAALVMMGSILVAQSNAQVLGFYIGVDSRSWATLQLGIEYPIQEESAKLRFDASIPVLLWGSGAGLDSFQLRLGAAGTVKPASDAPVCLVYEALFTGTFQSQVLGSFSGLGTVVSLKPLGTFGAFSIGPVVTWSKVWLTHISLSQSVKDSFSDSSSGFKPARGWYSWGTSELLAGVGAFLYVGREKDHMLFLGLGPRFTWESSAGLTEGFPIGEWPFWFEFGWKSR